MYILVVYIMRVMIYIINKININKTTKKYVINKQMHSLSHFRLHIHPNVLSSTVQNGHCVRRTRVECCRVWSSFQKAFDGESEADRRP